MRASDKKSQKSFTENRGRMANFWNENGTETVLCLFLIAFCIFSGFLSPYFFTSGNLANIGTNFSYIGTIAAGQTLVMLMGCNDLSQMPAMAISVMVIGVLLERGVNPFVAILAAVAVGIVAGTINGFLVTRMRIVPMIATIGTQMIFRALAFVTTQGRYITYDNEVFRFIGFGRVCGVPVMLIVTVIVFMLIGFILKYTAFGRDVYSVGSNGTAAYLSGISINRVKMLGYVISGITAGIAGVLWTAQLQTAIATAGSGSEMIPMAAVVIGGTSLNGGKGKVLGTFIGVALLTVFSNLMALLSVDAYFQQLLNGIILILAVYLDIIRNKGK